MKVRQAEDEEGETREREERRKKKEERRKEEDEGQGKVIKGRDFTHVDGMAAGYNAKKAHAAGHTRAPALRLLTGYCSLMTGQAYHGGMGRLRAGAVECYEFTTASAGNGAGDFHDWNDGCLWQ